MTVRAKELPVSAQRPRISARLRGNEKFLGHVLWDIHILCEDVFL